MLDAVSADEWPEVTSQLLKFGGLGADVRLVAISWGRGAQALAVGVLALVLLVPGAMPAAAGERGPAGSGQGGRDAPGAPAGGGHERGGTAKQAGSPAPAHKSQGTAPGPGRQSAAAGPRADKAHPGPRADKAHPAAPAKPSAARPPKPAQPKPAQPKPAQPKPAQPKPAQPKSEPEAGAPTPDREADDEAKGRPTSTTPTDRTLPEVRPETVPTASRAVSRNERPIPARPATRPGAAVAMSSADPTAALFAAPLVAPVEAAAVELAPLQLWPTLPGPMGHPAFPGLLAAVLLGFTALGCRGDRRDPKLAAAAIDDRDDRAPFR